MAGAALLSCVATLLQLLAVAAAVQPRWLAVLGPDRLVNEYGPTETVVGCSIFEDDGGADQGPVPIGRPIDRVEMYVLDGALEQINDMAYERFDMPVTEGDDPVEINTDILEELAL